MRGTEFVLLLIVAGCGASEPGRDATGAHGAVTAGHPLAADAGLAVLLDGGNAMDAAITMAAVLAVARPHMNGIGGDAFIIYYDAASQQVYALNGSGRSGSRATHDAVREIAGDVDAMPEIGPTSVSVPGAVGAWAAALARFGTRSWAETLEPAVRLAREGLPVSERLSLDIAAQADKLRAEPPAAAIFLPNGVAPPAGSVLARPDLATTLTRLAEVGPQEMYTGETGRTVGEYVTERGGFLGADDFAAYEPEWVEPLSGSYHDLTVYAMPPNTQGMMLIEVLGILQHHDLPTLGWNSADYLHTFAQAIALGVADRDSSVADPATMRVTPDKILDPARLAALAAQIDPSSRATLTAYSAPDDHPNTVALMAVDSAGNVVSMIQSLFHSFGSGLVVPGTGIVLQNRGSLFSLDPSHPNFLAPHKRPYHTLCPAFAMRDGLPWLAFGTPGGDGQVHTLSQLLSNILLFDMTPQEAIDAPRMRRYTGDRLAIEDRIDATVMEALTTRGYDVVGRAGWTAEFGGAQAILIGRDGAPHRAGADRRREGWALAY